MAPTTRQSHRQTLDALGHIPPDLTNTTLSGHDDDDDDTKDGAIGDSDDDSDNSIEDDTDCADEDDDGEVLPATETQATEHIEAQDKSPVFRLPPEIRNKIYKYVFNRLDDQCGWDGEHNCPKIKLLNASRNAPSSELVTTCRRIHYESRGLFVKVQRDFWSNTTFTLTLSQAKPLEPKTGAIERLENLRNVQISSIARIVINIVLEDDETLTTTLTPSSYLGRSASWCTRRAANYISRYSDALDLLYYILPRNHDCHQTCLPRLAYQQVEARIREAMWDRGFRPSGNSWNNGDLCVVCGENVNWLTSSDRRSGLLAVAAWLCRVFKVTL